MSQPAQIDPRGHRFAGLLTSIVLAAAIVAVEPLPEVALVLVAFQLAVFGVGGFYSLSVSPYARLFRRSIRPRIGPAPALENSAPAAFSQVVGTVLGAVALVALASGIAGVAYAALALALFAALLNAALGVCLGCELYLVLQRLQTSKV